MTIKELAAELGVSREAVRLQVQKLSAADVDKGKNRTTIITDAGADIIREWFKGVATNNNQDTTSNNSEKADEISENQSSSCKTCEILQAHIATLERELEHKNNELEAKNKQISDLMQALQNEQILHGKVLQLEAPKRKWYDVFRKRGNGEPT